MVQTASGYAVLEWYGGHDPDEDDSISGDISSYGMKEVRDETANEDMQAYVEEYGLTELNGLKKLVHYCH